MYWVLVGLLLLALEARGQEVLPPAPPVSFPPLPLEAAPQQPAPLRPLHVPGWHGEPHTGTPQRRPEQFFEGDDWNAALDASDHPIWYRIEDFFTRSTKTHGRSIGAGEPLRGTSWLNRPYEVSYQVGAFLLNEPPSVNAGTDNALFGALHFGQDFTHYLGAEFRIGVSNTELNPATTGGGAQSDTLTIADLTTVYYPWGDSRLRPYLRSGIGLTDLEFTDGAGGRAKETLLTIPVGLGVKYLNWRSVAWRAEIVNHLALGNGASRTLNSYTLTFGVEHRFGGVSPGYWAWRPRGTVR